MTCTCGKTEPHEIARRQTADGIAVCFWSDGAVTTRLGLNMVAQPATGYALSRNLRANALAADEIGLYDWAEVQKLVRTARRAIEQLGLEARTYLRRSMAGERFHFDGAVVTARTTM